MRLLIEYLQLTLPRLIISLERTSMDMLTATCSEVFGDEAKDKIDDAYGRYYGAWLMTDTAGVASDIDWNNIVAFEFLGPSGFNKAHQPNIQAVFANTAKVIHGYGHPIQHYIKVRCDDPRKRCQKRPPQDKCQPSPTNEGDPPTPTPLAYAMNSDPDTTGTPMINLCEGFFNRRSLADAISYGRSLDSPNNMHLGSYDNRALTFLHELFHLDLVADSPSSDLPINDFQINVKSRYEDKIYTTMAYGPYFTKILARYYGWGSGPGSVGYYIQRNADNLAYYALAKYMMSKNGNWYPYLPLAIHEVDGIPYLAPPSGSQFRSMTEGSQLSLDASIDDLNDYDTSPGGDYPGCRDDENENEAGSSNVLTIDVFTPSSAYSDDYNKQMSSWVKAFGLIDVNLDSRSEGHVGQQIVFPSLRQI
ncbi:hypothetical protein PENSTE_c010G02871 [Penicillium steckii]|uniref:Lysine-specific metallo-endopeptidase domain-containing protein n=1 Tax=Penicillium steckii TaxID=303698 RepID=A0A1V6T8E2_9EURO|nr:hypothetical protein PENSTE_c010G02871 [Penicillium steckii]